MTACRFRRMKIFRAVGLLLFLPGALPAQAPPSGGPDAIRNGGFESTRPEANLWNGVDTEGFLAGFKGNLPVLGEDGKINDAPMPVAVAVADLNGDGLPDLMSSDPLGYVRYYANTGSKEQPKFTSGMPTTPYLSFTDGNPAPSLPGMNENINWRDPEKRNLFWSKRRSGVRISLATMGDGRRALVAGNYFGDIFLVPQGGGGNMPFYPQPDPLEKAMLVLSKESNRRWGNVFAPLIHDWDGDGKADLLVGEGSYSANNVHFFPNEGSANSPAYNLASRSALALGEGREQLTPAIADVNGDGKDDLLVSDRRGRVTAYLRATGWKRGDSIRPSGQLSKAGGLTNDDNQSFLLGSGIHTIATGDLNGDGLFDLVVGKPTGRIAWSPNKGSKEQPKFDGLADLAGEKPLPATWMLPSQWDLDVGEARGNSFAFASCVSAQEDPAAAPPQGTRALKFGFAAANGSPLAGINKPGGSNFRFASYDQRYFFYDLSLPTRLLGAPNRTFMMQQGLQLQTGKPYTLSFQHKGSGVVRANIFVGWWGFKVLGEDRITRGARGATQVQHNHANEHDKITKDFRPSASWSTFTEKFTINFKNRDLKDQTATHKAIMLIVFELAAPDGNLYLDDLKLVPQG